MKNNLFILAQIITIISMVSFIFFVWKTYSLSGTWDQMGPQMIAIGIFLFCLLLFVCGIFYYGFYARNEWSHAYVFHILTGVIFVTFFILGYQKISETLRTTQYKKDKTAWEQRTTDKTYTSEKLGISFRYISESFAYGTVTLQETDDTVRLYAEEKLSGMIQVHSKDPKLSLIEALRKDFKDSKCIPNDDTMRFYDQYRGNGGLSGVPDSYTSFKLDNSNDVRAEGIIDFPPYPSAGSYNTAYTVMDTEHPDRYLIIISGERGDIDASKTESAFSGKSWRSTVRFIP